MNRRSFFSNMMAAAAFSGALGEIISPKELMAALLAYPNVKAEWRAPGVAAPTLPVIPISFVKDGRLLNYFSMVTTVGTPQTIAAQELRVECMFPADDATELQHLRMLGDGPAGG